MPLRVVLEVLLTELGVGATNSVATREAVPIFLERGAVLVVACNVAAGAGNAETRGRGAVALRCVACGETRQVYFRAGLGFLEGTPLCPCWIPTVQVLPWVRYTRHNFGTYGTHERTFILMEGC